MRTTSRVLAAVLIGIVAAAVAYGGRTASEDIFRKTVQPSLSGTQVPSISGSQLPSISSTQFKRRYVGGVALGSSAPGNPRRRADFAALRAMNATWVRSDLDWRAVEYEPGRWNFRQYDAVLADARAAGLHFLAILHTTPAWANGGAGIYQPPQDLGKLSEYCRRTALRYIPRGVHDYEIGNEVNLPHPGWAEPTGEMYVRELLEPCVVGIRRAARQLGARVNVVMGAVVPDAIGLGEPMQFLNDVYAAGGGAYFDTVAVHPYTRPLSPTASDHLNVFVERVYQVMRAHGNASKKIWATEYGYPTSGPHSTTETRLAGYVDAAVDMWYAHPFAGPLFWYSARDTGTDSNDEEQNFGLLRYDGTAKPAYARLAARFARP